MSQGAPAEEAAGAAPPEADRVAAALQALVDAAPGQVVVVGHDRRYRHANVAYARWHGLDPAAIVGRTRAEVLGDVAAARDEPSIERVLAGETVSFEHGDDARPGAPRLVVTLVPVRLPDGTVDGFVGVAQDLAVERDEQRRRRDLARTDPLTGLLNGAGFEARLRDAIDAGEGGTVAVLQVDLDRFKAVNDAHGRDLGDLALRAFAERMRGLVRPSDTLARVGGDVFALLLPGMREVAHARTVAYKVVAASQQPISLGTATLHLGASVGVAWGATSAASVVERAELALADAKRRGRGRVAVAP